MRGFSQPGRGINCVLSAFIVTGSLSLGLGLGGDGRVASVDRVAEVVVLQERFRLYLFSIGYLEILDVQRGCVSAQHLVAPQDRRVADHIDSVELGLDDRVADRRADATGIPE